MKNFFKYLNFKRKKPHKGLYLQVHFVTFLFAAASLAVGMFWLFATYITCLLVHEFCHALAAKKLGYKCGKIVLYPTGALLVGDTDEFGFADEIKIALAGPLSNLCLIIVSVFLWWVYPESYNYLADFVVSNLSLFLFNVLPIFPLDGGRVLLAFLSQSLERKKAASICKKVTIIFSILLFLWFVISLFFVPNFSIGIASIVMFITVLTEQSGLAYKRLVKTDLKRRKLAHGLPCKTLMFKADTPISKVLAKVDNFAYYTITIVDTSFAPIATITETQLEDLALTSKITEPIGEIVKLSKSISVA